MVNTRAHAIWVLASRTYLIKTLPDGLHDPVEVSRQQCETARIEQEPPLAARLGAGGTGRIAMRELLVLSESRDVLRRETETVVGQGSRRGRLLRRSLLSCTTLLLR